MWPLFSNIYAKQCLVIVVPKLPMPKCLMQDNFALNAQLCAETSHKQPVSVTMAIESVKSTECFLSTFLKVPTSNRNHNGYHSIILVLILYWRIMISLWEHAPPTLFVILFKAINSLSSINTVMTFGATVSIMKINVSCHQRPLRWVTQICTGPRDGRRRPGAK